MTPASASTASEASDRRSAPGSAAARARGRAWRCPTRRRLALGLAPTPGAGFALALAGLAFGPHGVGVVSDSVLAALDPVLATALATLGVLVGLDVKIGPRLERRLLAASSLEAMVTLTAVAVGGVALHAWSSPAEPTPWRFAVMLGICAASSSSVATASVGSPPSAVTRVGDLDDVWPIIVGMIALAAMREGSPLAVATLVVQAGLIAVAIAISAWLLVAQTASDSEQRVFVIGALLLLGGTAARLALSPLFAGVIAGLFWARVAVPAREYLARDVRYLQHPLIVVVLVVAGARSQFPAGLAGLVIAYIVLRTAGKLAGGRLAHAIVPDALPRHAGLSLLSPGLVGLAFALNVAQTGGAVADASPLITIVLAGSLGAELVAWFIARANGST